MTDDVAELRALLLDSAGPQPAALDEGMFATTFDPAADAPSTEALVPDPIVFDGTGDDDGIAGVDVATDGVDDEPDPEPDPGPGPDDLDDRTDDLDDDLYGTDDLPDTGWDGT